MHAYLHIQIGVEVIFLLLNWGLRRGGVWVKNNDLSGFVSAYCTVIESIIIRWMHEGSDIGFKYNFIK